MSPMIDDATTRRKAQLIHTIADLQAELATLDRAAALAQQSLWPKQVSLEAWVPLDRLDALAGALGLRWQARSTFVWRWHKIPLLIEVREDGTTTLMTCAGQEVGEKGSATV